MSLDGIIYVVRLFELQVDDITIDETRRVVWPRLIDIPKQPSLDGALILYDITDEESVNEIPDILCKSGLNPPLPSGDGRQSCEQRTPSAAYHLRH